MSIALIITDRDITPLQQHLQRQLPQTPIWCYPDIPHPEDVTMAVVWKYPPGILAQFPKLRLVSSFGAGVEQLLHDPDISEQLRLTRTVDPLLSHSMRNYVLMAVLNIQRQFRRLQQQQQQRIWQVPQPAELPLRIGVLGLGALGASVADGLVKLGLPVLGYSATPKELPGMTTYTPADMPLSEFAARINTIICVIPLTPQTEGILNKDLFAALPKGSFLINIGRGAHLIESDLLRALANDQIREAWLDVFVEEPLPPDHPFWHHPGIVLTPHLAGVTDQQQAAGVLADNYLRLQKNEPLRYEVDTQAGY